MDDFIIITDRSGRPLKKGEFTEPEIRMVARAGYRVFENDVEITERLTGLFQQGEAHHSAV